MSYDSRTYVISGTIGACRFQASMAEGFRALRESSSPVEGEGPYYAPAYDQTDGRMLDTSEFSLKYIQDVVMWDRSLTLTAYIFTSFGLAYVDQNDWLLRLPDDDIMVISDQNFQALCHEQEEPDDEPTG